jgi:dihydrofolate reductase
MGSAGAGQPGRLRRRPDQSTDNPLGVGGDRLHEWAGATRSFRRVHGGEGGDEGLGDQFVSRADVGIGATIMGRNMFGPVRGPLGRRPMDRLVGRRSTLPPPGVRPHPSPPPVDHDAGGTTFHFVDDGIEAALQRAFEAADGNDVRLGGGPATIQQYLRAGLVDELHLAIVPTLLGGGERSFDHLGGGPAIYECVEFVNSGSVAHARLVRVAE